VLLCRPTIFIEIIERRGCLKETAPQAGSAAAEPTAADAGGRAAEAAEAVAEKFKDVVQVRSGTGCWAIAACKSADEQLARGTVHKCQHCVQHLVGDGRPLLVTC
jgi:hypothetical protein